MNEIIKRRKDEGFTLIELMIVIAVIGILAVVLMPKMGQIKTSAKLTGVETNFRSVTNVLQGGNFTDEASVLNLLNTTFTPGSTNAIVNPLTKLEAITNNYSSAKSIIVASSAAVPTIAGSNSGQEANYQGIIVVIPNLINGVGNIAVYGCDETGHLIANLTTTIQP